MAKSRLAMLAAAAATFAVGIPPLPGTRREKYPGQSRAYRKGAWAGDRVASKIKVKAREPRSR